MEAIKKLPSEVAAEGITLEAVNSPLFLKRQSPAMLCPGKEPVALMCVNSRAKEKRFWAQDGSGTVLSSGDDALLVVGEEEARIGRARYLLLHGAEEEAAERQKFFDKVDAQVAKWKAEADEKMQEFYFKLQACKCIAGEEYENVSLFILSVKQHVEMIKNNKNEYAYGIMVKAAQGEWQAAEARYRQLSEMQAAGDYYALAKALGQVSSAAGKPIIVARYDNPAEMENLKSIFGREAIEHFAGDMLKIAAAIYLKKRGTVKC
jgi:hypothetical protein